MTRTELISAPASRTQCLLKDSFLSRFAILISWTLHRHEIICIGNITYLINNYLFRDNAVAASLWQIRE